MRGYHRNTEATAAAINADSWVNTGNRARQGPDGALSIVGRTQELIIRLGLNGHRVEVEQATHAHSDVLQCAVVGCTGGHNRALGAFVEKAAGSSLDAAALALYLRGWLAPYKRPSDLRSLSVRPAAPTAKVLKNVLKTLALDAAPPPPSVPWTPTRNPRESPPHDRQKSHPRDRRRRRHWRRRRQALCARGLHRLRHPAQR